MKKNFTTKGKPSSAKTNSDSTPTLILVNDRAATREAIIRKIRSSGRQFIERSQWKANLPKGQMSEDWNYSMIALHHAGRSYSCASGLEQMASTQRKHVSGGYDDIGYHFGVDCSGVIYEGRDIRFKGSSVLDYNTGVIGIVMLNNTTTAEEGGDYIALGRRAAEAIGISTTSRIPGMQIDAVLDLVTALKSVFLIKRFGGHKEYPNQVAEGKICPGNIGMELVRNIRTMTNLLPPPQS